jgi:hypothetical protein
MKLLKMLGMLSSASFVFAQSYTMSTFAGGAPPPTPIGATDLALNPGGASAANGNLYFTSANTVLQLDSAGVLTRLAGNGRTANGFEIPAVGTSIPALTAQFVYAQSVTADRAGNLYVVDGTAYVPANIWKITPDGQIRVVGQVLEDGNFVVLALDPSGGLYVTAGPVVNKVQSDGTLTPVVGNGLNTDSGDGGPALNAGLGVAVSIDFDAAGDLFVSTTQFDDNGNYVNGRVRVVTPDGIIRPFAGTGVAGYSGDGGPAISAQLGNYSNIWVDGAGDVFIGDVGNKALREVTRDGKIATVYTSSCCLTVATVDSAGDPYLIVGATGMLNGVIARLGSNGSLTPVAGGGSYIGDGAPATAAILNSPRGVAVDAAHDVYVDDEGELRIRSIGRNGIISTLAGNGQDRLAGDAVPEAVPAVTAPLFCPCQGIAADRSGNLFFTEWDRVRKISPDGILTTAASVPATGLAYDGTYLYIADSQDSVVWKLASDGTLSTFAGNGTLGHAGDGGPAVSAGLQFPGDVAVDGLGNVYIAEYLISQGGWIRKVTPDGTITTIAGGGQDTRDGIPATSTRLDINGIAADAGGNIYVVGIQRGEVRKITSAGIITTIAGDVCNITPNNPCAGYIGDGGPATSAQMNAPSRIAVNAGGELFVADSQNNAIRLVALPGSEQPTRH